MPSMSPDEIDLKKIRETLAKNLNKDYWRSFEELAGTEAFKEILEKEFPSYAAEWPDAISRRKFMKLMAASLALAGLAGCVKQPIEKIVPYVKTPENMVPGKPLFFATALSLGGYGRGALVESHMGRPTKIEGNPKHSASLGAADIFMQAAVLGLYDPDRSQAIMQSGRISTWDAFFDAISAELANQRAKQGKGMRILTETVTSPVLFDQLKKLLAKFPAAKWHQYDALGRDNIREGARLAFGKYAETQYRFEQADVVLSLDSDFLVSNPASLRYTRDFTGRRRVTDTPGKINRLYVVETTPSVTGSMADHRIPMAADDIQNFALALAAKLGAPEISKIEIKLEPAQQKWIEIIAKELNRAAGSSLVIAGPEQPPPVHVLAHLMNQVLGNVGKSIFYTDPVEPEPVNQLESLRELTAAMRKGEVETLFILGGNPVYVAPADLNFEDAMSKVKFRMHLGLYEDETSALSHWLIPEAHELESWGDIRAFDGTVSIVQPLIAPLYGGKSAYEFLAVLLGNAGAAGVSGYDIVREYWKSHQPIQNFEVFWKTVLHDGVIPTTSLPAKTFALKPDTKIFSQTAPASLLPHKAGEELGGEKLEINFRLDPNVLDGRFSNNGWLQELPKPLTKLTWDNVALISPKTAEQLSLSNEELVELSFEGRKINAPVWVFPGQAENSVTIHLGYGRSNSGRVGNEAGFNANLIRNSKSFWSGRGLEIKKTGKTYPLATTQHHHSMDGRDLVRAASIEDILKNPDYVQGLGHNRPSPEESFYPEHVHAGYAWAMSIDLNTCIGCNACVVACQSENNIPIVGKEEVSRGREMHWIRIDRYYKGGLENPEIYHQPVTCMHCENAPCEPVCPVGATVHSPEGLNEMVYNRCVGTKYCSNNCSYKVRRFNFFEYADQNTEVLKLMRNPNVSVRVRGVMEKCSYCVQRIQTAKIQSEKEDRQVRDGEIVTACQASCPAQAIVFGNLHDPESKVTKLKKSRLNYGLLEELNTKPRTTYLAKIKNPNPEI